jgi:hypothetical protein
MKKCLISFVGLCRTFEKTADNIFNNIIIPNMKYYNVDIVLNTDLICKDKEDQLFSIYNRYNQVKKINYSLLCGRTNGSFYERFADLFLESENVYDIYIIVRFDVIINKIINLNDYNNTLSIISGNFKRPCLFHNRDWDYIWISSRKPLYLFLPIFLSYNTDLSKKFIRIKEYENEFLLYDSKVKNCELDQSIINEIYKKTNISGYYYNIGFSAIYILLLNNCKFILSEKYRIYSTIIR